MCQQVASLPPPGKHFHDILRVARVFPGADMTRKPRKKKNAPDYKESGGDSSEGI